MARLHRARVTAVGSEQDMYRMAYVMLENGDWLPEEDEGPTPTLEELLQTSQNVRIGRRGTTAVLCRA